MIELRRGVPRGRRAVGDEVDAAASCRCGHRARLGGGLVPRGAKDDETEVSWRLIRRGMPVVDPGGEVLGRVTHLLGDPDRDIFAGVAFRKGLFGPEYTADLEVLARITEAAVHLRVSLGAAADEPSDASPSERDGAG